MAQNMETLGTYKACAIYYDDADCVEYVRDDVPSIYRRIDDRLSLILDMYNREPIGFCIKGFKNFYMKISADQRRIAVHEFPKAVVVIEKMLAEVGDAVFSDDRVKAYERAITIAEEDRVELRDLPKRTG